MGSPNAGSAVWHDTITTVEGTDPKTATSVAVGEEELADRTTYLRATSIEETAIFAVEADNPPTLEAAVTFAAQSTTLGLIEMTCLAGDELLIDASGVANGLAGCAAQLSARVDEKVGIDTTEYIAAGSRRWIVTHDTDEYYGWSIAARHVVTDAGPVEVKLVLQLLIGNGGGGAPQSGDTVQIIKGLGLRVIRRGALL